MATLDLHYVNELIEVRQEQHGGYQGAPYKIDGHRVGASLNRSCIVMLSALLQSFVEEVFFEACVEFLGVEEHAQKAFRASFNRWGNPSDENIRKLFNRMGVGDVLADLTWRGCRRGRVQENLRQINELRNQIAHGARNLTWRKRPYSLSLAEVGRLTRFAGCFGEYFPAHARWEVGLEVDE
jgi:hypothetical protein